MSSTGIEFAGRSFFKQKAHGEVSQHNSYFTRVYTNIYLTFKRFNEIRSEQTRKTELVLRIHIIYCKYTHRNRSICKLLPLENNASSSRGRNIIIFRGVLTPFLSLAIREFR